MRPRLAPTMPVRSSTNIDLCQAVASESRAFEILAAINLFRWKQEIISAHKSGCVPFLSLPPEKPCGPWLLPEVSARPPARSLVGERTSCCYNAYLLRCWRLAVSPNFGSVYIDMTRLVLLREVMRGRKPRRTVGSQERSSGLSSLNRSIIRRFCHSILPRRANWAKSRASHKKRRRLLIFFGGAFHNRTWYMAPFNRPYFTDYPIPSWGTRSIFVSNHC